METGVLYIAYDGMLEPLGQSQVLAYLEHLAAERPIHLLSFEKAEDWADTDARARVRARMDAAGIPRLLRGANDNSSHSLPCTPPMANVNTVDNDSQSP